MAKVLKIEGEDGAYMIFCPGCKTGHKFDKRWTFNGDMEKPTFRASMLVKWTRTVDGVVDFVCHSFVTDGKIEFLDDCTHKLKGQTVDLPDF